MSEMVERVARAIGAVLWSDSFEGADDFQRAQFSAAASAAIEAMREPTGEMMDAADYPRDDWTIYENGTIWRAMIDAALKD